MSSHGITAENLLASYPEALRKSEAILPLARTDAGVLARRIGEIQRLRIYTAIDEMDEELLDILAQDFKVDWWDKDYSVGEKRRTLKSSWQVHRILGTRAAVEKAISAIYPETTVQEWWEYDGRPYHFKLFIDSTFEHADPKKHRRVLERVAYYKNLRSHLDQVEYTAVPKGECVACCLIAAAGIGGKMTMEVMLLIPLGMLW